MPWLGCRCLRNRRPRVIQRGASTIGVHIVKTGTILAYTASLFVAVTPSTGAPEPTGGDPLAALDGRWTTVGEQKKYGAGACKDHWSDYAVSADKRGVRLSSADGKVLNYLVLYTENDSATMYIEGESRRLQTGDRVIWVLIRESRDSFSWRAHGRASNPAFAEHANIRCK